ncbi:MAG: Asparagine--tRNA ligase [Chlamydiia bacterium]|nr:Asparagine--tRNA ligase [Chlamydiia bacterium]
MMTLATQEGLTVKLIKQNADLVDTSVKISGWIKTIRKQKSFSFAEINDGSCLSNLQIIINDTLDNYEALVDSLSTGASVEVEGVVVKSPGGKQAVEIQASSIALIGSCPEDYPLQKKRHSFEFLRTIAHLRPRTNSIGAVARVRSKLAYATHTFFNNRGFLYVHTPIITASDCEGAGELFRVTTLEETNFTKDQEDFFATRAYLTVSGQLNAETYACGLGNVYTFGPTFRAENSNTSRHLAEFWMIEPEMAFCDLIQDMQVAEDYIKFMIQTVMDECQEDIEFFDRFVEKGLIDKLTLTLNSTFERVSYTDAIEILKQSNKKFEFSYEWGENLQSEHERYLAEEHFNKPVIVYDYPKSLKPFYMRANDDGKTVAAMDVLIPGIGELIGGSQREERLDIIEQNLKEHDLDPAVYGWYTDLRKYGSVPHAGFGLGFERMVLYCTGMENIRDVIPFPRTPDHCEF